MKNSLRFVGPATFLCGLVMLSLSLIRPAGAQPRTLSGGVWHDFNTQPAYPPGAPAQIQEVDGNLNRDGGADFVVYVPELHRMFAHYSR